MYAGQSRSAAAALQAGAEAADENAPLLSQIRRLALRARVPLQAGPEVTPGNQEQAKTPDSHGLTSRELVVLQLLATGRTNAQIGAELFISPKTASVHVTNILRKLSVTTRVQAAAVAERAGLLRDQRASGGLPELVGDVTLRTSSGESKDPPAQIPRDRPIRARPARLHPRQRAPLDNQGAAGLPRDHHGIRAGQALIRHRDRTSRNGTEQPRTTVCRSGAVARPPA